MTKTARRLAREASNIDTNVVRGRTDMEQLLSNQLMCSNRRPFAWDVQALPGMPKTAGASLTGPQTKAGAKLFYFGGASRRFRSWNCPDAWLDRWNGSEWRPSPCGLLLLSKNNNRVDTSGFGRRQAAGHQGGDRQNDSDQSNRWWVVWLDSIEHAAHDTTHTESDHDACSVAQKERSPSPV